MEDSHHIAGGMEMTSVKSPAHLRAWVDLQRGNGLARDWSDLLSAGQDWHGCVAAMPLGGESGSC